jgi:hypothetical protein
MRFVSSVAGAIRGAPNDTILAILEYFAANAGSRNQNNFQDMS